MSNEERKNFTENIELHANANTIYKYVFDEY